MDSLSADQQHSVFYLPHGHDIYRVGNVLYKLHRDWLIGLSDAFDNMFKVPQPAGVLEGSSNDKPIDLYGFTAAEFDHFLFWLYPHLRTDSESEEWDVNHWTAVMKVAHLYNIAKATKEARDHVRKSVKSGHENPAVVLERARKWQIDEWFSEAFHALIKKDVSLLTLEDGNIIGTDVLLAIMKVKDRIHKYRANLAIVAPQVKHHKDCTDCDACKLAFVDGWWKDTGRAIHDPAYPQSAEWILYKLDSFQMKGMTSACWNMTRAAIPREAFAREKEIVELALQALLPLSK